MPPLGEYLPHIPPADPMVIDFWCGKMCWDFFLKKTFGGHTICLDGLFVPTVF
jgi:hypothetical protein